MATKNTTHLAGEFLVAGELARRGYPVSITMGNAKSVDIYAESANGVFKIDTKTGRAKSNWPISKENVQADVFNIFVHLQSDKQIENNIPPEYFIVSGSEIISDDLIKTWETRQGITPNLKHISLSRKLEQTTPAIGLPVEHIDQSLHTNS